MNKIIYIIAGEESGDLLGAPLMKALKQDTDNIEFYGIGGKRMIGEGLSSLFPMERLSVMGVAEILPKLFDLLKAIKQTVLDIEEKKPDIIVTIDSPDFCFRVIKSIKKRGKIKAPCVHYVAPSVWAWRPGRAKKVAKFLDHILTLLPFEPPYFEKEGLASSFVGHPVIENKKIINANGNNFRKKYNIPEKQKIFCVLAGSRHSELKRMLPVFKEVINKIKKSNEDIKVISITLPYIKDRVIEGFDDDVLVLTEDKYDAFAASDVALATSGTVALELAMIGTPTVIGYRMGMISTILVKLLVTGKYASLPNIILDKPVIPELLLGECIADNCYNEVQKLLLNATAQKAEFAKMRTKFDKLTPSKKSAEIILKIFI